MKHIMKNAAWRRAGVALAVALLLAACGGEKPEALVSSAKEYLAKNDVKGAVIQLKNALQANGNQPEARFLLGKALLASGDVVGGETELRKALDLKHSHDEVVPALAQAMLGLGQFKKLTDEFAATQLGTPQAQASLKTSLSAAYAAQGNQAQSRAALDAALSADPQHMPALLVQARGKAVNGDFDGALAATEGILKAAPNSHEAMKLRGDIKLYGKKDEAGALADFRKSLEFKPDFLEAHTAILSDDLRRGALDEATKDLDTLKKSAPNSFQARYFDTMVAFQKKDMPRAKELGQQLLKMAPNNLLALQLAGAIEMQGGSLLQADAHLSKALQMAPGAVPLRRQLAAVYLGSGQVDKAMATLQPLLKSNDQDVATNSLLGQAFLQSGDAKKAEEYFAKAAKQDPKNSRTRIALALTHLSDGRAEAGLGELQDIAGSETDITADMALISAQLRRQDFDKALKAIDALEKKQPASPLPANLRGRALLAKKDPAGARKSFERSLQLDPTYFASVASLAALDVLDKKPEDARKRFNGLLEKDPKNGRALLALAELRVREGGTDAEIAQLLNKAVDANPTDKTPRLLLINHYLRNKDQKQALSSAQAAVAAVPDSPELLDALGQAQQASGDSNQALVTFNKVASMQPASPIPQMRIAATHMVAKNKDAAAQALHRALDIQSDFLDAQVVLLELAMADKKIEEAIRIARTVQKQRPKEDIGYRMEGDVAVSQKNWEAATAAYTGGLKASQNPLLAVKVHDSLLAASKASEAEKFGTQWLRDHPKDAAFRLYIANGAIRSKDYAGAEKLYQTVLQIQPNNAVAYNNLAWVAGQQKKDAAIGYAEKAVALAPKQPAFIDTLAMLLSDKSDYAKALEWQQKAVALQPDNGLFKTNLAKIYIKAGNRDLARKELEEVAKLGDKYSGQAEVGTLLKSL